MDTIKTLQHARRVYEEARAGRFAAIEAALCAGLPQHEIATHVGVAVRTVGGIAQLNGIGRLRGRPRRRQEPT